MGILKRVGRGKGIIAVILKKMQMIFGDGMLSMNEVNRGIELGIDEYDGIEWGFESEERYWECFWNKNDELGFKISVSYNSSVLISEYCNKNRII